MFKQLRMTSLAYELVSFHHLAFEFFSEKTLSQTFHFDLLISFFFVSSLCGFGFDSNSFLIRPSMTKPGVLFQNGRLECCQLHKLWISITLSRIWNGNKTTAKPPTHKVKLYWFYYAFWSLSERVTKEEKTLTNIERILSIWKMTFGTLRVSF